MKTYRETCSGGGHFPRLMRIDSSAVVRRHVFPQPVVALGITIRGVIVPLVLGGFGQGITENLVN
jgi:hypothetical protein